jgi:hypothetical protein
MLLGLPLNLIGPRLLSTRHRENHLALYFERF